MIHEAHCRRTAMKKIAQIKASLKSGREALGVNLHVRFHMMVMRHAQKTKGFIKSLYYTRLRAHFDLPLVGENEEKDKSLHIAVDQFFDWNYDMSEESTKDSNNAFYQWMQKNDQAMADLEVYHLLSHWTAVKENEKSQISQSYHIRFNKKLVCLDVKAIGQLYDVYKKKHRLEFRKFLESKALRVHLDLRNVMPHLKLISIFFVVGGYIYASMLYGYFGISPGQFFSVGDYLVMSLDQIGPLALAVGSYIAAGIYRYRWHSVVTKYEMVKKSKSALIPERIIILLCGWILIMHIWHKTSIAPELLTMAVFAVVHNPVVFLANRYFENNDHAAYAILFIVVFGACLYFNAEQKIKDVEAGQSETTFEVVTQSKTFTEDNSTLIGSNSRYIFLKTDQNNVEVFRLNKVNRISFQKESN